MNLQHALTNDTDYLVTKKWFSTLVSDLKIQIIIIFGMANSIDTNLRLKASTTQQFLTLDKN